MLFGDQIIKHLDLWKTHGTVHCAVGTVLFLSSWNQFSLFDCQKKKEFSLFNSYFCTMNWKDKVKSRWTCCRLETETFDFVFGREYEA